MPVYKYKTLEQAESHLEKLTSRDPLERLSDLHYLIDMIKPVQCKRGVFKFKSIEDAEKHLQS